MAGPCASVLLRDALDRDGEAAVRREIGRIAERAEGDDFWVDGRPFFLSYGEEYEGEFEDFDHERLADILGWRPRGAVGFAAMCNSDIDHRLLAQLCIRFAKSLRGIIDFGGALSIGPSLSGAAPKPPVRVDRPGGLRGVLFAACYQTAAGPFATVHYGDVEFAEAWLEYEDFRMVK